MASELEILSQFLREASGLVLDTNKAYLVENRLHPLMRRAGFTAISELLQSAKSGEIPISGKASSMR